MTYVYNVKETTYGSISVEADNEEEAREKAWQEYYDGYTDWSWDVDTDINFEHKEERE